MGESDRRTFKNVNPSAARGYRCSRGCQGFYQRASRDYCTVSQQRNIAMSVVIVCECRKRGEKNTDDFIVDLILPPAISFKF